MDISEKAKYYRKIAGLYDIKIMTDYVNDKAVVNKIFTSCGTLFSINAVAWKGNDWQNHVKITSKIRCNGIINIKKIKYELLCELYKISIQKLF